MSDGVLKREKLSIAHVTSHGGNGGDWSVIRDLRRTFTDAGHDVVVLGANSSKIDPSFEELRINEGAFGFIRSLLSIRKVARKTDILHSHSFVALLFCLLTKYLRLLDSKIVHTFHWAVEPSRMKRIFVRWLLHGTNCVHVCSQETKQFLSEKYGVPESKIRLAYIGADEKVFRPAKSAEHVAQLRKKMGLSETAFVILFAGRIAPEKGIEHVLQYLGANRPKQTVFLIVGEGDWEQEIQKVIAAEDLSNQVFKYPKTDRLEQFYQISDLLVLPSVALETFGLVVVEAALTGVPCLRSDLGGAKDQIEHEKSGFVYPVGDQVAFSDTLTKILDGKYDLNQIGERARSRAIKNFTHGAMMRDVHAIYNDVLAK